MILHAGTPKYSYGFRPYVYETIDEYIKNINFLIKTVEKIEDIYLIVRFRPIEQLQLNDFLELLIKSECYSVHTEGAFTDYLAISDILVSYSSTTIEEALQNRIPVLMYDPQGKYCHIKDAQLLEPNSMPLIDSCYFVDAEEKLKWALEWLIKNHLSNNVPDCVWKRHVFEETEKVTLTSYFKNIFPNENPIYTS